MNYIILLIIVSTTGHKSYLTYSKTTLVKTRHFDQKNIFFYFSNKLLDYFQ